MHITFSLKAEDTRPWIEALRAHLPEARMSAWLHEHPDDLPTLTYLAGTRLAATTEPMPKKAPWQSAVTTRATISSS